MLKYLLFVETNFQQTITYFLIGHWCIAIVQLAKMFKLVEYKVAEDVNTQVKYPIIVLNLPVYSPSLDQRKSFQGSRTFSFLLNLSLTESDSKINLPRLCKYIYEIYSDWFMRVSSALYVWESCLKWLQSQSQNTN